MRTSHRLAALAAALLFALVVPAPAAGYHPAGILDPPPYLIRQTTPGGTPEVGPAGGCTVTSGPLFAEVSCPVTPVPGAAVTCDGTQARALALTGGVTASARCGAGPTTTAFATGVGYDRQDGPGGPWGSDWPFVCRADFGPTATGAVGCEAHVHVTHHAVPTVIPLPGGFYLHLGPHGLHVYQETNGCGGLQPDGDTSCGGNPDDRVA